MTSFGRAEEPRSVLSAGGGTFLARARAILFAALASREAEMPRARPGPLLCSRDFKRACARGAHADVQTRSVMPATRSATRSGKASLVEPAAPHWITTISSTDARRLHLIRWGWHLSQILPFVLYYAGAVEAPVKFPASISFTQRQGWVIGLIALFWAPAWIAFLDLIRRNASAPIEAKQALAVVRVVVHRGGGAALAGAPEGENRRHRALPSRRSAAV